MSEPSRLTFVRFHHSREITDGHGYKCTYVYNLYKCKCGKHKVASRKSVRAGNTKSCGCLAKEVQRNIGNTYGVKNLIFIKKGERELGMIGGAKSKGRVPHNKGKVFIPDYPNKPHSTGRFVKPEEADALYWGLEGEVHSLEGQRWKRGDYRN